MLIFTLIFTCQGNYYNVIKIIYVVKVILGTDYSKKRPVYTLIELRMVS